MGPELRVLGLRLLAWLAVAWVLLLPTSAAPTTWLLGDERIDVWNHAWGFWYVAQSLASGRLPLWTELAGAPAGGALYFIDTPSAVAWAPVTLLAGPALAYNLSLLAKVALAGLSGQLLALALGAERRASWLAGLAMCTLPSLLCELDNGISEVCGLHWATLTLWALARQLSAPSWRHALALGLFLGLTGVASFYFGLGIGLLVAPALAVQLLRTGLREPARLRALLPQGVSAAALSIGLVLPVWLAFRSTLVAPDSLIQRPAGMTRSMLEHNAVDPRVYVAPGDFQSVDLAGIYGEPFVHTAYLRWSLLLLAGLALWRRRALRGWVGLVGLSLVLGMGSLLWWDGAFVEVGGRNLSLPFGWLLDLLPEVAITHPLRLSLGAQILVCGLAGVGLSEVLARLPRGATAVALLAGLLVAGEGLFASAARWPISRSPAAIPESYAALEGTEGPVFDLPAEVGTTMITSRYFWYQTSHGHPIPYVPDVRAGGIRDFKARRALMRADVNRASEVPQVPTGDPLEHLVASYAGLVVHGPLEEQAGLEGAYTEALGTAFGEPSVETGGVRVWRMDRQSLPERAPRGSGPRRGPRGRGP